LFLGIDLGTSALKTVLVDDRQKIVASASVPIRSLRPRPSWSEQNPQDWWRACRTSIARLAGPNERQLRRVQAIGLSGQMHGAVLLGRHGTVLRPAILWNDARSRHEAAMLGNLVPDLGRIAGVPAMASFTAPKLLWLRANEPESFAALRKVLLPKDYLRFRLTGACATDMSDAAGSLLLDTGKRCWSADIRAAVGLSATMLPELFEGPAVSGYLDADVARTLGLAAGIPVAAGAGDAAAAAVGLGIVEDGDALVSLGTSAQYFVARRCYRPRPESLVHTFCHALPNVWYEMAALLNGAGCLAWLAGVLGRTDPGDLLAEAERAYAGPSPEMFLPYLAGERTPHNDPDAKGVFIGLSNGTRRADLVIAVLEGVALSLADCRELLHQGASEFTSLPVSGGGARSHFWMRLLADVLGVPLDLFESAAWGPASGAARLARLALTGEPIAAVCTKPEPFERIEPHARRSAAHASRLAMFRRLYTCLAPLFAIPDAKI
jgi:xylulokinase